MQGESPGTIYSISEMLKNKIVGKLTLGRNDWGYNNDLSVLDDVNCYISRYHATIEKHEGNKWIIRDGQWRNITGQSSWLRSTNGTFVNGIEIDDKGRGLQLNDIITIGETTIKFQEI
jgi:pSer/pThr/pTyr-binding forkhead associated (FHA) protein